jgi:hypothetical protein
MASEEEVVIFRQAADRLRSLHASIGTRTIGQSSAIDDINLIEGFGITAMQETAAAHARNRVHIAEKQYLAVQLAELTGRTVIDLLSEAASKAGIGEDTNGS